MVRLVLMIVALQGYFEKIWKEAVYEKVLIGSQREVAGPAQPRAWNLTHYMYADLDKDARADSA